MGNFIALSGVVGKTESEVLSSLKKYASSVEGGINRDDTLDTENDNCCIIEEANNNTTIFYPYGYLEWDASSEFISKDLNAAVFSFHIHDGDLWMYILYHNGQVVDQFNPIPDYWGEDLGEDEIESWKGNAAAIAKYAPYINIKDIENYLVRWDLDEDENTKAYPTDESGKEEWQLVDFMTKLKLPYPIDDDGKPKGHTYKYWTNQLNRS